MIGWSDIKGAERRSYFGYKSIDHNYYIDGKKVYCIRFYYKNHIRARKVGYLQRLDFTLDWYTGEDNE